MEKVNTREQLAQYLSDNGFKTGVEVGVERGVFTEVLCKAGLKVYAVDAWKAYKGYREHVSQEKLDQFYVETTERLDPYDCEVIRGYSLESVNIFEDETLDFVYLDANHSFVHIAQDLDAWSKKVRKGGIVAGHDYKRFGGKYGLNSCHVKDVVNAWVRAYQIQKLYITEGDSSPSWFYVKQ